MKNFGLIGAAGYIAQRHLKAIKETNNNLCASVDINDSVGILDQYFPKSQFFLNIEDFVDYIGKSDSRLDYISVCSPNYLHNTHIRLALRNGSDAICEKPIVLSPWELDDLSRLEMETGKKIYTILQLRHHAKLALCKENIEKEKTGKKKNVILTYITGRGNWYQSSWKGDVEKSGGIATNIGIHLFDLLIWLFGPVQQSEVHLNMDKKMSGFLELENAYVSWFLSIDFDDLPDEIKGVKNTFRSILIDNGELEFSEGFTDLHTVVYKNILEGKGVGIKEARPSIELLHQLKGKTPLLNMEKLHPIVKKIVNVR
jgi:UDP-N-acetyl-2-amino-2-deoxyglucuronate dehydrogenase